MVEMGWVGVSINYRLAPRDAYPAQIIDVKKAIAWVKQHIDEYGGDPDFIVVTGGSAGGHLSLLAGLTPGHSDWQEGFEGSIRQSGVLAMYPVVDLTNRHGIRQQDRMDGFITRRIIQQTREAAPHVFEDGSPLSWIQRDGVAKAAPPFVLFKVPTIRWCGSKKCAALLRSSAPLRPTLLFTQSCRAPSMRLRFSIRRAPVTFSMPRLPGWNGFGRSLVRSPRLRTQTQRKT